MPRFATDPAKPDAARSSAVTASENYAESGLATVRLG